MVKDVVVRVHVASRRSVSTPIRCEKCQNDLDLHQPNPERPDEILGICQDCGEWHFLRLGDDAASLVIARLPVRDLASGASSGSLSKGAEAFGLPLPTMQAYGIS
jgi:hypothetical protein